MADHGEEPPPKRVRLSKSDCLKRYSREDIYSRWEAQEAYIEYIELKRAENEKAEELAGLRESEAKLQQQQQESTRRENVLVMRLATKEQEIQELLPQIHELKNSQAPSAQQLRSALLDPAVNLLFQRLTTELDETKAKLSQAQDDMSAWKFTPDSVTGKKLMAKCRSLIVENQELGKQLSQGRIAQLEAELALQKKYSEELKASQDELNEFILQLDEEVEGMQSTIMKLQGQLRDAKQQLAEEQQLAGHPRGGTETTFNAQSPRHQVAVETNRVDGEGMQTNRMSTLLDDPSTQRTSSHMHDDRADGHQILSSGSTDDGQVLMKNCEVIVEECLAGPVDRTDVNDELDPRNFAKGTDDPNGIENT